MTWRCKEPNIKCITDAHVIPEEFFLMATWLLQIVFGLKIISYIDMKKKETFEAMIYARLWDMCSDWMVAMCNWKSYLLQICMRLLWTGVAITVSPRQTFYHACHYHVKLECSILLGSDQMKCQQHTFHSWTFRSCSQHSIYSFQISKINAIPAQYYSGNDCGIANFKH